MNEVKISYKAHWFLDLPILAWTEYGVLLIFVGH